MDVITYPSPNFNDDVHEMVLILPSDAWSTHYEIFNHAILNKNAGYFLAFNTIQIERNVWIQNILNFPYPIHWWS